MAEIQDNLYLIRSNDIIYTTKEGVLEEVGSLEVTAELFTTYGSTEIPDGSLFLHLINPEILYWQDTEELPIMKATVNAIPYPQTIESHNTVFDSSIVSISSVDIVATDTILFQFSSDDGESWKAYDLETSSWVIVSENGGMNSEEIKQLTVTEWSKLVAELRQLKIRFTLNDKTETLTSIIVNYARIGVIVMAIKGKSVIELYNPNTRIKQRYEDENIVTNAFKYIFGQNICAGANKTFMSNFLPLYKNGIGGIILFDSQIEENPNIVVAPNTVGCTGYASTDAYSGSDLSRGGMNTNETSLIDNGMKFVWDFATSQANGDIACVSLTHAKGGKVGYGSKNYCDDGDTNIYWFAQLSLGLRGNGY